MPSDHFDDDCAGCRPVLVDVRTAKAFPDNSIEMTTVNRLWQETTLEERQAWHRFTCQNSRAIGDVQVAKQLSDRLGASLANHAPGPSRGQS
jgi:hypothetical protein